MATATKRTLSTTPHEWSARLASAKVSKQDLNALVADYLYTEGYLDAATEFAREANLDVAESVPILESIRARRDIRACVQRGEIEHALDQVVELDPEILEKNPSLHFALLQQHLIELIRQDKIVDALEFAQAELAPRGEDDPKFLQELEKTMALLAFEMPSFTTATSPLDQPPSTSTTTTSSSSTVGAGLGRKKSTKKTATAAAAAAESLPPMPASLSSLLSPQHRTETCVELNAAILASRGDETEPKLPRLVGVLNWGEGALRDKGGEWPRWDLRDHMSSNESGRQSEADEQIRPSKSTRGGEGDVVMF